MERQIAVGGVIHSTAVLQHRASLDQPALKCLFSFFPHNVYSSAVFSCAISSSFSNFLFSGDFLFFIFFYSFTSHKVYVGSQSPQSPGGTQSVQRAASHLLPLCQISLVTLYHTLCFPRPRQHPYGWKIQYQRYQGLVYVKTFGRRIKKPFELLNNLFK